MITEINWKKALNLNNLLDFFYPISKEVFILDKRRAKDEIDIPVEIIESILNRNLKLRQEWIHENITVYMHMINHKVIYGLLNLTTNRILCNKILYDSSNPLLNDTLYLNTKDIYIKLNSMI